MHSFKKNIYIYLLIGQPSVQEAPTTPVYEEIPMYSGYLQDKEEMTISECPAYGTCSTNLNEKPINVKKCAA